MINVHSNVYIIFWLKAGLVNIYQPWPATTYWIKNNNIGIEHSQIVLIFLTYEGCYNLAVTLQVTFSNAFSSINIIVSWCKFYWNWLQGVGQSISQ